jgi:putative monooxygenase
MSENSPAGGPAKPVLLRPSDLPSTDRGGGNKTILLVSGKVGSRQMINGITVIAAGQSIALHTHNCEESVCVIEGSGLVEIAGMDHAVDTFDTTWLPANTPHRFKNPSGPGPLKIFWIYASADATRTLVATGETRSIASEDKAQR